MRPQPAPRADVPWWRRILAALLAALGSLATLTWGAAMVPRLPEQIPSHFGPGGTPDAWSDTAGTWRITALFAGLGLLIALASPLVRSVPARLTLLLIGTFVSTLTGWLWFSVALSVLAAAPDEPTFTWQGVLLLPVMLGWLALVVAVHGRGRITTRRAAELPRTPFPPDVPRSTTAQLTSRSLLVGGGVAVAVAGIAVVLLRSDPWFAATMGLILGLAALTLLVMGRVRLTVDERGVRLTALGGLPIRTIPLDQIVDAEAIEIRPQEWGGWGYRWVPGTGSAYVVRRGPGMVVDLADGGRFAVTIDHPEQFVRVLTAHVAARSA